VADAFARSGSLSTWRTWIESGVISSRPLLAARE
jgi:hypothetical protein